MRLRVSNPEQREVLVNAQFVENVRGMSQRVQTKRCQLRALAEASQSGATHVHAALDLVNDVLLDDAVDSNPDNRVEDKGTDVAHARAVVDVAI